MTPVSSGDQPLRKDEVLVSAFVDVNDFMGMIPVLKLFQYITKIPDEDLADIFDTKNAQVMKDFEIKLKWNLRKIILEEMKNDTSAADVKEACPYEHVEFETLQHEMLYESFEAARFKHPIKLGELLDDFNKRKL